MPPSPTRRGPLQRALGTDGPVLGGLLVIGLVVGALAAAFAYTAGWLSPDRLTPGKIVEALSRGGGRSLGHRRNHAKGICFTGYFEASGAGAGLSTAPMLAAGRYPVIGRFAIVSDDPQAPDASARVRSMALRITAPDGQEWRTAMNSSPVFIVRTPRAFYELLEAAKADRASGRSDPDAVQRFLVAHPETVPFSRWALTGHVTASYADLSYNSLDAFLLVDAEGRKRAVRWSMRPTTPPHYVVEGELDRLGPDFLEQDLEQRLARGELRWHMVVTLAAPGDPTDDATRAWPAGRRQVDVGTLVVRQAQDEASGLCRDYSFDPLILPRGIEASDDPLLPARSAAYANSFDRRAAEAGAYPRTPAAVVRRGHTPAPKENRHRPGPIRLSNDGGAGSGREKAQ